MKIPGDIISRILQVTLLVVCKIGEEIVPRQEQNLTGERTNYLVENLTVLNIFSLIIVIFHKNPIRIHK